MPDIRVSRAAILSAVDAYAQACVEFSSEQEFGDATSVAVVKERRDEARAEVERLVKAAALPVTLAELAQEEAPLVALYRAAKQARGIEGSACYPGVFTAFEGAQDALKSAAQVARLDGDEFVAFVAKGEG